MNAFGVIDGWAGSRAIIRILSQGTRSSRFWRLGDIRARGARCNIQFGISFLEC